MPITSFAFTVPVAEYLMLGSKRKEAGLLNDKSASAAGPSPLLSYAFRPFFLLNGLFAIAIVGLWLLALRGAGPAVLPQDTMAWHGHEMIVGFAMAAFAGFALTAVATWTGRPPVAGATLGWLLLSWLSGRAAMLFSGVLPAWLTLVLDCWFPLLLCVLLGREVLGAGNRRNLPIVGIALVLAALNVAYHLGAGRFALYALIHVVLLLITVIAGRIVPSFTANWLRARGVERLPATSAPLDVAVVVATVAAGIAAATASEDKVTGVIALVAAALHGVRMSRWRGLATTSEPLLFVLHVAYLWLPVGYALTGCAAFGLWFPPTSALHALTMGAIGTMILAVSTRVALGHTGRKLHAARAIVAAYCLLTVAVVVRVLGALAGDAYMRLVDASAAGWMIVFAIFTWVYWPILTRPKAD